MSRFPTPLHHDDLPEDEGGVALPSKSQLKRESEALQKLGVALVDLNRTQLAKLDLPEKLVTAVLDCQRIGNGPALKRQRQYIGKLMRDVDPAPIQAYLDRLKGNDAQQIAWLHRIERQRDALLASDEAVQALIAEHPDLDIQALRQRVRNARAERAAIEAGQHKPPKHFRALFQFLKELSPAPAPGGVTDRADADPLDEDD
jgi:ribosome-associated protein